jgi:CBS domain-containing membrane protein
MTDQHIDACVPVDISDDDVYEAMKDIQGYLDITPGDFKEVYLKAYQHALQRLTRSVKVSEVMTREVATVSPETPLKTVAEIMSGRRVSGLPVIDLQGKVVGIISDKDFLSHMGDGTARSFMDVVSECLKGGGCVATPVRAKHAGDIMNSPAITVSQDTSVMDAARILVEKGINRLPIVDENGRLVGIVSRADVVRSSWPGEAS